MSMSLPAISGYGNTFVDERKEKESSKFWWVVGQKLATFPEQNCKMDNYEIMVSEFSLEIGSSKYSFQTEDLLRQFARTVLFNLKTDGIITDENYKDLLGEVEDFFKDTIMDEMEFQTFEVNHFELFTLTKWASSADEITFNEMAKFATDDIKIQKELFDSYSK